MSDALFVSDIHLRPGAGEKQRRFLDFLEATRPAPVYILGDLFDYWIGTRHYALEDFRSALAGLARAARGRDLALVPGNRDYLLDPRFTRLTGVRLLGPTERLRLAGRRVVVAHGDFIFNRNSKYVLYRRLMRWRFLADSLQMLPGALALRLVSGYRTVSVRTTPAVLWDDEALARASLAWLEPEDEVLICGHIHSPRHLLFGGRELLVLGDWDGGGEFARLEGGTFRLDRFSA